MLSRDKGPLNILQLACAIGGIVVFLLLPVVSVSFLGMVSIFGIRGLLVLRTQFYILWLPLFAFTLMLVFSFGPLQRASLIVAGIALIMEMITAFAGPGTLLNQANLTVLVTMLPQTFQDMIGNAQGGLTAVNIALRLTPGLGSIIGMLLTLVYAAFSFVNLPLGGGSSGGNAYSGRREGSGSSSAYSNKRSV